MPMHSKKVIALLILMGLILISSSVEIDFKNHTINKVIPLIVAFIILVISIIFYVKIKKSDAC